MNEQIVILDFGSQYTQVIARRVRECNVYSVILRYDTPAAEIAALKPSGIILSGGPSSVYAKDAPLPDAPFSRSACRCSASATACNCSRISRRQGRERPEARIRQGHAHGEGQSCALFAKSAEDAAGLEFARRQAHETARGFKPVAVTENSRYAAIENRARKFFGLQFHPEVVHTPRGKEIIANFVHGVCGCGKNWTMRNYVEQAVEEIRAQVGKEKVILG
jgi:GMP synthase (glutamine-hydrolysing)